jgi:hypothetical protein
MIRTGLHFSDLPHKDIPIQSNLEKNIRKPKIKEYSTKCLTSPPQNCQDYQKQEKSKKLS